MIFIRSFNSYDEYRELQGTKARKYADYILSHQKKSIKGFSKIFQKLRQYCKRAPFLCLGARDGSENKAACLNGFPNSVGLDLHPLDSSVIKGDWHNMPFGDSSYSNIYTNSIDHCAKLLDLMLEIKRVLTDDGVFILQMPDKDEWKHTPYEERKLGYEALFWQRSYEVCQEFESVGFFWQALFTNGRVTLYKLGKKKNDTTS